MKLLAGIVLIGLAAGCASQSPPSVGGGAEAPAFGAPNDMPDIGAALPELDGVWRSNGYGYAATINDAGAVLYDVTASTCVTAQDEPAPVNAVYTRYRLSADGDRVRFSTHNDPYEYEFRRVETLPSACATLTPNTPLGNFEAFAAYFAEHYAFFELYGVDWDSVVTAARRRVTPDMSDEALFALMSEMLSGIRDAHVEINAEIDGEARGFDANMGMTEDAIMANAVARGETARDGLRAFRRMYWNDDVAERILGGQGSAIANNRIQYGLIHGDIGYIAILTEGGFGDGSFDSEVGERELLDRAMGEALTALGGARAMIVDVSMNFGGYDFISRAIAGHFTGERRIAYRKLAADADGTIFTDVFTEPSNGARFLGPVWVLTSDVTVSGGETLTMAMRALDNVTHVGMPTRGALSDTLVKTLPNGWEISISNEIYLDADGVAWEGRGITPEIEVQVFDPNDPMSGHAAAVGRVVELINAASPR